jgi:hypothetical protein
MSNLLGLDTTSTRRRSDGCRNLNVKASGTFSRFRRLFAERTKTSINEQEHRIALEDEMGRGLLLWLIGIPIPIILVIWLLGGLN